jgi:enoyl-CoA hydratase/carnithine racemase
MRDAEAHRGELRTEVRDRVGYVTLHRPAKRNALTREMWSAIPGVMQALSSRTDLVAIAIQGAEGTFGAGADLGDVLEASSDRASAEAYCTTVVTALLAVATTELPTVAWVAGVAAGGGAELALACDLRVADATASFSFPFARLGVVPDRFTLDRLTATVGQSTARRLVFTGEVVDARAAFAMKLVDDVVAADEVAEAKARWSARLSHGSRAARVGMKRALRGLETTHDVASLTREMVASIVSGDVRDAAQAFLASVVMK